MFKKVACICVYAPHACLVPEKARKKVLGSLELELQMVVSCHMGTGNRT